MNQQPMSSQLDLAGSPLIFPKPPSRDAEDAPGGRSIHVLDSVRRHKRVMGLILLVCLSVTGFFIYLRKDPVYEAKSRIYISPTTTKAMTEDKQQIGTYDSFVEEQVKTVTRYDVLSAALKKVPIQVWSFLGRDDLRAIARLQKDLSVERLGASFEVEIDLKGPDAHNVANVVNTITDTYLEQAHHEEFFERDQRLALLRGESTRLQAQLADKESQEQALFKELGVGSIQANGSSPYNDQIAKLQADLTQATEQYDAARSNLSALETGGRSAEGLQAAAQDASAGDPGLVALKTNLNQQRGILVTQMAGLTPANPQYRQDEEQLKAIDAQIVQTTSDLQAKTAEHITHKDQSEIAAKRLVVEGLQKQLMDLTQHATGSAPKFQQAQQISSDIDHLQTDLAALADKIRELEVDSSAPGSMHLLTPAMVPVSPNKNKTPLIAAIMVLMSICASVVGAVALDYLDPHIYGADDVKHVMGFPPIGLLLDHDHFSPEVSQQYLLRLAAALHHAVRSSGARTFLFTATEPGGGTTTLVEKVARQLRSLNMRTLTIAATNVDGKITYVSTSPAPEPPPPGPRAATGPSDKLERVQQPGPMALKMHLGESAQSMFSGSFVAQILSEHQNDYDIVLIDGGPILISADAEYLARIADGTVVVTQSGRTTRNQLKRSAALLEKLHVPGVAVVLNRIHPDRADSALRKDIEDFQQQMVKQRGTKALARQYLRPGTERDYRPETTESRQTVVEAAANGHAPAAEVNGGSANGHGGRKAGTSMHGNEGVNGNHTGNGSRSGSHAGEPVVQPVGEPVDETTSLDTASAG